MINNNYGTYILPTFGIPVTCLSLASYCKQMESELNLLREQCRKLTQQNTKLKTSTNQNLKQRQKINDKKQQFMQIKEIKMVEKQKRKRRRRRRSYDSIQKHFKCLFGNCTKQYGSELALNLHMKIKHNGGTKTQREELAKEIILAKDRGIVLPQISINFPPGFLEQFRNQRTSKY